MRINQVELEQLFADNKFKEANDKIIEAKQVIINGDEIVVYNNNFIAEYEKEIPINNLEKLHHWAKRIRRFHTEDDFTEYYKQDNKSFVEDGVIYQEKFDNSSPKILWILKEAHAVDKTESWNQKGFLGWGLASRYSTWKATFGSVVQVNFGLLNKIYEYDKIKSLDKFTTEEIDDIMQRTAFINVKKHVGNSSSEYNDIKKEYLRHKEVVLAQIRLINPDIIINGSGIWEVFDDCMYTNTRLSYDQKFIEEHHTSSLLSINTYHPGQTQMTREDYCKGILKISKMWIEEFK